MDRRKALKNMGMALGYTVATPTLISLVQSCKNEPAITWSPVYFSTGEAGVLSKLVDLILPKTDTPSASELQVDVFIDRFVDEVMPTEHQNFFRSGMGKFTDKALADSGKTALEDLAPDDLEAVLASTLKVDKAKRDSYAEAINDYIVAITEGKEATLTDELAQYAFADRLRGLTVWGYSISEYIGEEVLAYLPVPGEYIACGSVSELTGGKTWSLDRR